MKYDTVNLSTFTSYLENEVQPNKYKIKKTNSCQMIQGIDKRWREIRQRSTMRNCLNVPVQAYLFQFKDIFVLCPCQKNISHNDPPVASQSNPIWLMPHRGLSESILLCWLQIFTEKEPPGKILIRQQDRNEGRCKVRNKARWERLIIT